MNSEHKPPWEQELESAVLAEEYAKRGESYDPAKASADPPPAVVEQHQTLPPAAVEPVSDDEQDQLVNRFELEFSAESVPKINYTDRLVKFIQTPEGRVVIIALIACIILVILGRWLGSSLSSQLPPQ